MPSLKLTDTAIEKLTSPETGTIWYSDPDLRGFQLAVGKRVRTFYAIKALEGRNVRKKLGQHPLIRAKAARESAMVVLGQISQGVDPRQKRSDTLGNILADYIDRYTHASHARLSAKTALQYRRVLSIHCPKWLDRDVATITKHEVSRLHQSLRDKPYTGNQCLRVLRMMFKHAVDTRGFEFVEPTRGVRFFPEHKRISKIDDWTAWYQEVLVLPLVRRNYYIISALTGIRRSNLASLSWSQVDLLSRNIKLMRTKNGTSPTLPLSQYACDRLAELRWIDERWVFPADSKSGHIIEPRDRVRGRIHDLRRMFTTAAGQSHLPEYVIARLRGDVGAETVVQGYMDDISDHAATEQITRKLLAAWLNESPPIDKDAAPV